MLLNTAIKLEKIELITSGFFDTMVNNSNHSPLLTSNHTVKINSSGIYKRDDKAIQFDIEREFEKQFTSESEFKAFLVDVIEPLNREILEVHIQLL